MLKLCTSHQINQLSTLQFDILPGRLQDHVNINPSVPLQGYRHLVTQILNRSSDTETRDRNIRRRWSVDYNTTRQSISYPNNQVLTYSYKCWAFLYEHLYIYPIGVHFPRSLIQLLDNFLNFEMCQNYNFQLHMDSVEQENVKTTSS